MLAILMALTMIVANFAIIAVNAEDGHAHAEEVKCPGVGEEHDKSNCDWTKGDTVAPTETVEGYTYYKCNVCKAPFLADFLPKLDVEHTHVWGEPVVVEPSDCTHGGTITTTCTTEGCGEKTVETIPAPGHTFVNNGRGGCVCENCGETNVHHEYEVESFTAPTKDVAGLAILVCDACGDRQEAIVSEICDETHEWKEIQASSPTCTKEGTTRHIYCATCGFAFYKEVVDALGHTWDDGKETKPADCLNAGTKTYTCTACGATKTEVIEAGKHNEILHAHRDADCLVEGYDVYTCTVCGEVTKTVIIPRTDCKYDVKEVKPDCVNGGSITSTCPVCGDTKTETVPALGHTEKIGTEANEPTCTEPGNTVGTICGVCGVTLTASEEIPALGCDYSEENGTPAYCDQFAETWKECVRCGNVDEKTRVIGTTYDPDNHRWGRKVITAPTCTETGLAKVWCQGCDKADEYDEIIPANGHTWDEGTVTTKPTCTQKGVKTFECTVDGCGATKTEEIAANGHTWGSLENKDEFVLTPETCIKDGSKAAKCLVEGCDAVATAADGADAYEIIAKNPAKFHARNADYHVETLREPTCEMLGLDHYKCGICGFEYTLPTEDFGDCELPARVDPADYDKLFCTDVATKYPDGIAYCEDCGRYFAISLEDATTEAGEDNKEVLTPLTTTGENPDLVLHDIKEGAAQDYDCMTTGWDAYEYCTKCTYTTKNVKVGLGHNFITGTGENATLNIYDTVKADCDDYGYTVVYCSACYKLIIVDYVAPLGHTYGNITGIFECNDERLLEALKDTAVTEAKCDTAGCGMPIHNIKYHETVETCEGIYDVYFCTNHDECGYVYTKVKEAFDVKLHDGADYDYDMFKKFAAEGSIKVVATATATTGTVYEATCKYCGDTMTWIDNDVVDQLTFGYEIFHATEDLEITDYNVTLGGVLALVIKTTSPGVEVNSIGLKLNYDATRLEFISGTVSNDKFSAANSVVYGNDNKTGATLTVLAVTEDGNIALTGEEELAVVFFRVLVKETDDDTDNCVDVEFAVSDKSQVLDDQNKDVAANYGADDDGLDYCTYKLGDLFTDEELDLRDLNEMALMTDLDYEGEYVAEADINRDGAVDIFDYQLLVDLYLEKIGYVEFAGYAD